MFLETECCDDNLLFSVLQSSFCLSYSHLSVYPTVILLSVQLSSFSLSYCNISVCPTVIFFCPSVLPSSFCLSWFPQRVVLQLWSVGCWRQRDTSQNGGHLAQTAPAPGALRQPRPLSSIASSTASSSLSCFPSATHVTSGTVAAAINSSRDFWVHCDRLVFKIVFWRRGRVCGNKRWTSWRNCLACLVFSKYITIVCLHEAEQNKVNTSLMCSVRKIC